MSVENLLSPSGRVVVVGAGNVGASAAYAVLTQDIANEIMIIDIAEDLARAQVLDLQDAASFTKGVAVKYGQYSDLEDGDIVVVTAGAAQKEGQTRLELLEINVKITKSIISAINATGKRVYLCMVTNPVDVLTYVVSREAKLPSQLIFGSGTYLDSARLRRAISDQIKINTRNIHAYILGEHGDSSFPGLSIANVAGVPLKEFMTPDLETGKEIDLAQVVRDKAYVIIKGKKATYYGIGVAIAEICRIIIRNEERIIPLSVPLTGQYGVEGVSISVPAKLSSNGVQVMPELQLSQTEKEQFNHSVKTLKDNIKKLGLD